MPWLMVISVADIEERRAYISLYNMNTCHVAGHEMTVVSVFG